MRRLPAIVAAAILGTALLAEPASSRTVDELYREGVAARQEDRFADAIAALEEAARREPENADVHLQLGYARLGAGELAAAERSFGRTLEIAPDYEDARLGLAYVALRRGDRDEARRLSAAVLQAQPGNAEAENLLRRASAEENLETNRWRFDAVSERSDLSGNRRHWTDSAVNLAYRLDAATTVGGRFRLAERRGITDRQFELRLDRRLNDDLSVYGAVALAPGADFLARQAFGAGAAWQALPRTGDRGPLTLLFDGRYEIYPGAEIWTIFPGAEYRFAGNLFGVTARWIHAEDNGSAVADGYLARLDIAPEGQVGGFIGYADAPEISQGKLTDTKTVFGGIAWRIDDRVTLRLSLSREERVAFDRNTVGLGLTTSF